MPLVMNLSTAYFTLGFLILIFNCQTTVCTLWSAFRFLPRSIVLFHNVLHDLFLWYIELSESPNRTLNHHFLDCKTHIYLLLLPWIFVFAPVTALITSAAWRSRFMIYSPWYKNWLNTSAKMSGHLIYSFVTVSTFPTYLVPHCFHMHLWQWLTYHMKNLKYFWFIS